MFIADGVKGVFIARRESLVTWDLRASVEAERRGRASWFVCGLGAEGFSGGVERVDWNWSRRARVVSRRMCSCLDILGEIGGELRVEVEKENFGGGSD